MIQISQKEALVKVSGLIEGWKPAKDLGELKAYSDLQKCTVDTGLKWTGAPVPASLVADALALIKKYPFEVSLVLFYNAEKKDWKAYAPKQSGSGAYVAYDGVDAEIPEGYFFSGTIHSHPRMSAFWSGTDTNDQHGKAGLHMVVGTDAQGNMTSNKMSIFFGGSFYDSPCFELPDKPSDTPPEEWVKVVDAQALKRTPAQPKYSLAGDPVIASAYQHKYGGHYRWYGGMYSTVDDSWENDWYGNWEGRTGGTKPASAVNSTMSSIYEDLDIQTLILDTLDNLYITAKDVAVIEDKIWNNKPDRGHQTDKTGDEMDMLDRAVIKSLLERYYPNDAKEIMEIVDSNLMVEYDADMDVDNAELQDEEANLE